jgi:hypothetical protein
VKAITDLERMTSSLDVLCECIAHATKKTLPKHPLLCATAKELADRIERYKASCTASNYRLANGAFMDAWRLLVDVRNLPPQYSRARGAAIAGPRQRHLGPNSIMITHGAGKPLLRRR